MVAAVADDGVALAVAKASAKLLASPEVDELEADYAKWGYYLAAGLLGLSCSARTKVKFTGLAQNLGQLQASNRAFQSASGPTCELWATLVNFILRDPIERASATDLARPGG
jgi:hypothetical protein